MRQAFVREYLVDLNAAKAALRAGYSRHAATGFAFLSHPDIKEAIERAKAQRAARVDTSTDQVLEETSLLALSNVTHYVITDEGQVALAEGAPDGAMAAIQSIKHKTRVLYNSEGIETAREYDVELKLWDKPGALKLMGRHVGLFADRVEVTGKDGGPIELAAKELAAMPREALEAEVLKLAKEIALLPENGEER